MPAAWKSCHWLVCLLSVTSSSYRYATHLSSRIRLPRVVFALSRGACTSRQELTFFLLAASCRNCVSTLLADSVCELRAVLFEIKWQIHVLFTLVRCTCGAVCRDRFIDPARRLANGDKVRELMDGGKCQREILPSGVFPSVFSH